jgi:hypothetical protein
MTITEKFSNGDIWKGIILFGLNTARYKMALAKKFDGFFKAREKTPLIGMKERIHFLINIFIIDSKALLCPSKVTHID